MSVVPAVANVDLTDIYGTRERFAENSDLQGSSDENVWLQVHLQKNCCIYKIY